MKEIDFTDLDADQMIFSLEQIDEQLTNLMSLYKELGDPSKHLKKFETGENFSDNSLYMSEDY